MKSTTPRASHSQLILTALKAGERITGIDALALWGCFSLPQRISELRKAGNEIKTTNVNRDGKTFAKYHMELH